MNESELSLIVAYDRLRTIGRNNQLPWAGQLPADLRHFKELTLNKSVIMGRSTYESLPTAFRPLPNRQNIVLSRKALSIEGVTTAHSLKEAYSKADLPAMVIGGANVYEQALLDVDKVYATEIHGLTLDGDAFFPELPSEAWQVTNQEFHLPDEKNKFAYAFVTYIRQNPTSS